MNKTFWFSQKLFNLINYIQKNFYDYKLDLKYLYNQKLFEKVNIQFTGKLLSILLIVRSK
jgi:hypothetical protein